MAVGIEVAKGALENLVLLVNAEEKLRSLDLKALGEQLLDADEGELLQLVDVIKGLDLKSDELEAKVKSLAASGAVPLAFILRLVKVVFPKQPKP